MKKYFPVVGAAFIFAFGLLIHYSYIFSEGTVWSILISSINGSPWETLKPFSISYIMWIVIELSILRPSLLHFVCAKILALYFGAAMIIIYSLLTLEYINSLLFESLFFGGIFLIIIAAQLISYRIYYSNVKIEIFWIPLLLALFLFLVMILFFSLYPPHFIVFCDIKSGMFGLLR